MFRYKNGEYLITGVKKIAGMSKDCQGYYGNYHLQIMYDPLTGKTWANEHADPHSETVYEDPLLINCGVVSVPVTMDKIKNIITWRCTAIKMEHNSSILERIQNGENISLTNLW